jgi:ribosomal protein S18 acetylase RimI-like enzyme
MLRCAVENDRDAIAELHVRCWQEAYAGQLPLAYLDSLAAEQRTARWATILASTDWPSTGTFVLDDEAGLVGFAHVCPSRDSDATGRTGEITSIYVRRHAWDQGAGRTLMTAALSTLADARFDDAILWVLDTNERARRFYEAGGWQQDGAVRREVIGDAEVNELRYRRLIAS